MCGISGFIQLKGQLENIETINSSVNTALNNLEKRGPDNKGLYKDEHCVLGHRRLSILDTSASAHQPMSDDSKRYYIVFNGEIYNFKQLQKQLQNKGFLFKTNSDTEVLLYAYIAHGKNMLSMIDGFFSFCIYDKLEQSYLLARDRFGIKPLLYELTDNTLAFSSEMKGLTPFIKHKKLDNKSMFSYFTFNYIPESYSIFQGIKKLPPAHLMTIQNGLATIEKYYTYYNPVQPKTNNISYEKAKQTIRALLEKSVQNRMISDVPIGTFLSGGIDLSIVSTIASKLTSNLHTFSLGFKDEPFFDETKYALMVAKNINSNHHVFSISNDDLYDNLHNVLDYLDEPFADSSALNVYLLSQYTKQHVTVALSGDGADELFSGYNKHSALFRANQSSITNQLLKHSHFIWKRLPQSRNGKLQNTFRQLQKYSDGLALSPKQRYLRWASFTNEKAVQQLMLNDIEQRQMDWLPDDLNHFNNILYADFNLVLTGDMLRKVDSMSMANSLEVRTPFLQHDLVDFVFSLPQHYKIDDHQKKKILKDAFKKDLPPELFNRPKHGFEVPLLKWFQGNMKGYLDKRIFNRDLIESQGLFNWSYLSQLKRRLNGSNPKDSVSTTWALVVFQHWYDKNISSL